MEEYAQLEARQVPGQHRAGRPQWIRRLGAWWFRRLGWTVKGSIPGEEKLILVVGPHTSNWDFVVAALAMLTLDIELHFLAKHSLFKPPLKFLLNALGGIPINRSRPEGFAVDAATRIRQSNQLLLAITPEGTRSKVDKLKTGFSRIAGEVPCPLLPVLLDFEVREIRILPPRIAGSPEEDAEIFRQLFSVAAPKKPENFK